MMLSEIQFNKSELQLTFSDLGTAGKGAKTVEFFKEFLDNI
jgi:hypothetical protein